MTIRRLLACLAATIVLSSAMLAEGTAAPQQAPASPVHISVRDQDTWVPRNTEFKLDLAVIGAPTGAMATTTVFQAVGSRTAFANSLDDSRLVGPIDGDLPPVALDLAPPAESGGRDVAIRVLVRDGGPPAPGSVNINQFGVFPVEVVVRSADGRALARLVTHLVRLPDPGQATEPVVSSLVLPFGASPALQPDGTTRVADADRARLAATADSLVLHPGVPLTVAVTPETLDGLHSTGNPADEVTLGRLADGLKGEQLIGDPYVRLDPSAWLASGLEVELAGQQLVGAKTVGDRLGVFPTASTQLAGRDLSSTAFARMQATGTRHLVAPAQAFTPADPNQGARASTRPFMVQSGPVTLPAAQVDARFQAAFTRHADDPVLGAHELLAELATLFGDDPTELQGVVLLPPAGFAATPQFLGALLDGLRQGSPVVLPANLDALFDLLPPAGRNGGGQGSDAVPTRRLANRPVGSLGAYPDRLRTSRSQVVSLQSLTGGENRRTALLNRQLLVSGSNDLTPAERLHRIDVVNTVSGGQLGLIEVPDKQTVTLASSTADIPLTIRNQLSEPVTLRIELQASKRLEFPGGKTFTTKPLAPLTSTRISIRVRTRGSGVSPVQIIVRTPDGRVLQSTRYRVQSTAVSGVGLIITIGAALFLVLWWGRHLYQERRNRRRPAHRRSGR